MNPTRRFTLMLTLLCVGLLFSVSMVSAEPVKLRFQWSEQPAFVDQMTALIDEFNRTHPNIVVELELTAGWQDKLAVAFAGGAAPDVVVVFSGNVRNFAANGMLLNITPYVGTQQLNAMHPAQRALVTHNGEITALPFTLTTIAVLYNVNLFNQAGLPTPTTDINKAWTWNDFRDIARKLRLLIAGGNENSTAAGAGLGGGDFWRLPWFYQNGAALFNADETQAAINSPEAAQTLTFLNELYSAKLINHAGPDQLAGGNVGMAINGHWDMTRVLESNPDMEVGATYLPYSKQQAVGLGGDYLGVISSTKYPKEAFEFVQFLSSRESTIRYSTALNYISPWRGVMPNYTGRFAALMPVFYQQALVASSKLVTDRGIPGYSQITPIFQREFAAAVEGRKSPAEALDTMEIEFNATLFSKK
jgi:multiple sugar transport system substrate-binding protein